jgi:hypothetical protein
MIDIISILGVSSIVLVCSVMVWVFLYEIWLEDRKAAIRISIPVVLLTIVIIALMIKEATL